MSVDHDLWGDYHANCNETQLQIWLSDDAVFDAERLRLMDHQKVYVSPFQLRGIMERALYERMKPRFE